jgi:hypothetical protein
MHTAASLRALLHHLQRAEKFLQSSAKQKNLPEAVEGYRSPNPTVVMVIVFQYMQSIMCSNQMSPSLLIICLQCSDGIGKGEC